MRHHLTRHRLRRLTRRVATAGCALALVAGVTACGSGDDDTAAASDATMATTATTATTIPAAEPPADGSAPAGGFDPADMRATIESFRQCLVDQGLDVADVTLPTGGPGAGGPGGGGGGTPPDGSMPAPGGGGTGTPPDGSMPQRPEGGAGGAGGGLSTERVAQMLGLDATDATVADAALDVCAPTLETT